jgi:hypothetical protein
MTRWFVFPLVLLISGCGGRPDELTPYLEKFATLDEFHEKFVRYEIYLGNPALERQARDIREVLQKYKDTLESFGSTKNKFINAGHNTVKRAAARSLTQLVDPDFPTFTVSAKKQVAGIRRAVQDHYENLEKQWVKAGKTDPFPLKWPESE